MISLRSKITQNVLSYLFLHPGQTFYLNELARQLKVDSGNLTRKLNELTTEGILQSEVRGNLKYFGLNSKFPLLDEYRRIVQKTVGVEVMLKEALEKVDGVKQAYLYGSYAANRMDSSSDIDVLVIETHESIALQREIVQVQKRIGREINCTGMTEIEFSRRRGRDPLLKSIFSKPIRRIL